MTSSLELSIRKEIGHNIARLRKKKGLSQKELAKLINMSLPNLSYLETGKYTPRLSTLIKLSKVLGVALYEFFILSEYLDRDLLLKNAKHIMESDEASLRLIYRIYLAVKSDFSR